MLLVYLRIYATWLEIFHIIDCDRSLGRDLGLLDIFVPEGDHRISRDEWRRAIPKVRAAAATWAPYVALRGVSEADFDDIDQNRGGMVDLQVWLRWRHTRVCMLMVMDPREMLGRAGSARNLRPTS